jgi:hypothetical protein
MRQETGTGKHLLVNKMVFDLNVKQATLSEEREIRSRKGGK